MMFLFFVCLCSLIFFSVVHYINKTKKPLKRAFISLLCGPVVLVVVNLLSSFTGVVIPVSELSVTASIVGGIPGVALLAVMQVLL